MEAIAKVIDLVGEPAAGMAARMESSLLKDEPFRFERLLLAIATARHSETEAYRLGLLRKYANDPLPRIRRAAVRALSRMSTEGAKETLKEISGRKEGQISSFASALLR